MDTFLQLTWNGLAHGTTYALLGMSFGLILSVSFRFHTAYQVTYILGAFTAAWLTTFYVTNFWLALVIGGIVAALVGVAIETFIYQPLAKNSGGNSLLMIFVASLGVTIVVVNLLPLINPLNASVTIPTFTNGGHQIGPVTITDLEIATFVTSWVLILGIGTMLATTSLGRMIRAVAVNPEMAMSVGVDPKRIFLIVFAIGSFMSGVAGVFSATQTAARPDLGITPFFYALVVAFVSSLASNSNMTLYVGLGLGLLESWVTAFMPTELSPLIVFVILFIYVALRPVDFAALRRKYAPPKTSGG